VFGSVLTEVGALAEHIAARLGLTSQAVVEVVRLHLEALDAALSFDVPELLADQLRWQQVRLESAGAPFGPDDVDRVVREALSDHLDDDGRRRIVEIQHAAAVLGNGGLTEEVTELVGGPALDYLDAALAGKRDDAIQVVRDALEAGVDVAGIMLGILQPAQIELGRLWEKGQISIAHEHYTTAVTQLALSLLYPQLLRDRVSLGRNLVATTVGSEAHELGIRMVADLLEHAGWRTTYLGADVPHEDVVDRVALLRAEVLAVSATMAGHVRDVRDLIAMLRSDRRCARVRVIVGGRPFQITPRLASLVGADGWAPGAAEAIEVCRAWADERIDAG
jgi:methanogenic corrinoid protein MtbC1